MIAAIIVLYHPEPRYVQRLVSSLAGQVQAVIAVDNTPHVTTKPEFLGSFDGTLSYMPLGENRGLAKAQNIGIAESIRMGCSHVLLLDQDSALPPGMVSNLLRAERKLTERGTKVAAVGPLWIDEKSGKAACAVRHCCFMVRKIYLEPGSGDPVETDNVIASGALIRIAALEAVGMMRSDLFIDFIDTEWGLRARRYGYESYCVPDAIMRHVLGDRTVWVCGKEVDVHSDIRHYYRLRNSIYLLSQHTMGWGWRTYMAVRIPYYFLLFVSLSEHKSRTIRLLLKAILHGARGRLGSIDPSPAWGASKNELQTSAGA